jgi:hypothetical protein
MTDFFADLEAHLLDAAQRRRRPRPRPRIVLAVAAAAATAALLIAVLPQSSVERGAVGGGPPAALDGWTSYVPLPSCDDSQMTVTSEPPPQVLRDAYELFRRPAFDRLPDHVVDTLARMGVDDLHEAAAREARGPDYSRVWVVPVGTVAAPDDCDARSQPAVCLVASDESDPSCVLDHVFVRTGFTRLFFDVEGRPVVVGLAPDGVAGVLIRVGDEQVELSVNRNNFAATLDAEASNGTIPDGSDVKRVEDLDVRWRYEGGRVVDAVTQ